MLADNRISIWTDGHSASCLPELKQHWKILTHPPTAYCIPHLKAGVIKGDFYIELNSPILRTPNSHNIWDQSVKLTWTHEFLLIYKINELAVLKPNQSPNGLIAAHSIVLLLCYSLVNTFLRNNILACPSEKDFINNTDDQLMEGFESCLVSWPFSPLLIHHSWSKRSSLDTAIIHSHSLSLHHHHHSPDS